jgi:hypothetical protein
VSCFFKLDLTDDIPLFFNDAVRKVASQKLPIIQGYGVAVTEEASITHRQVIDENYSR